MSEQGSLRFFEPPAERGELRVRKTMDPIESYHDRDGYDPDFLGSRDRTVALPDFSQLGQDVALRKDNGGAVLDYRHFSVVMHKRRRLPILSAVNINGRQEQTDIPRTNIWKRDPRIDEDLQILQECYGKSSEGYFSRGHMTRREDPNWGTVDQATQADADTFHATNAAPQAQSFNSPIWLGLENHLLRNAHSDDMKISVLTGPVFSDDDIEMFGVPIPQRFWKVVAFIHDELRRLTVTGYMTSQAVQVRELREVQFVFGKYKNWQVHLGAISTATGLDFSHLEDFDPLKRAGRRFAHSLDSLSDIYTE